MKTNLYIRLAMLSILLGSVDAFAHFTVAPMRFEFQVEPDQPGTGILIIRNVSEEALSVKLYTRDFRYDAEGGESSLEPGSTSRSCAEWISISPRTLDLEPQARREARISLAVPEDARGTYWAMVFVEQSSKPQPRVSEGKGYTFQINVVPRWGIRIFETIPETGTSKGEVTYAGAQYPEDHGPLNLSVDVTNTGNILLKCKGRIEIRDETGETVKTLGLNPFTVYPDGRRRIRTEYDNPLKSGHYTALSIIDFGGDYLVAGEAAFEVEGGEEHLTAEMPVKESGVEQ